MKLPLLSTIVTTSFVVAMAQSASINNPTGGQCAALNTKVNICLERAAQGSMSAGATNGCANCANRLLNELDNFHNCTDLQEEACDAVGDCFCGACSDELEDYLDCAVATQVDNCPIHCSGSSSHGVFGLMATTAILALLLA
jgi:hypothetical protein